MAIPPNIKLRLDQLKAQAAMKAEMERRRAMAQQTAEKVAGEPPKLPIDRKAEGGQPSQDAMRLMLNKQGMYSPLEKSLMAVPRAKGTPAEFMAEASKQPGFRAEEVADRKIALPQQKMTKAQMLAALQQNHPMPQVEVMIKGGANEDDLKERAIEIAYDEARKILGPAVSDSPYGPSAVQEMANGMLEENMRNYMNLARDEMGTEEGFHEDYTLPGGENYREILLKKPEFKGYNKIRNLELELNRVPPEKRSAIMRQIDALKTERERHGEVFSGNPSHFGGEPAILASIRVKDRRGPNGEKILHVEEIQSDWHQKGRKEGYGRLTHAENIERAKLRLKRDEEDELSPDEMSRLGELEQKKDRVPDAPFKKSWHEMALKHVLGIAAKEGYHGIAITPGAEQADRYDLSKHVDQLMYQKNPDGTYKLSAQAGGRGHMIGDSLKEDELEQHVGKEVAQKIAKGHGEEQNLGGSSISQPPDVWKTMSGLDLKVGGEGMKGFYDKIVPSFLNKLAKPHGVQVQMHALPIKVRPDLNFPEEISRNNNLPAQVPGETKQLHYLPINDAMRNKIKTEGLPQYRSGGDVQNFDNGGAAFGVFPQMRGRRSQQDPQASADVPVALARGTAAGLLGTPADLLKAGIQGLNWSFGPGGVNIPTDWIPFTSEKIEKMLPLQSASQTPVGKAATTLGELVGGGLSGPATKTLAELPGTLRLLGKEFPVQTGVAGPAIPIGEKSPMFDKLAKLKAERMERAGATEEEIKAATGLERGYDGMWRQEQALGDLNMRTAEEIAQMGGGDLKTGVLMSKAFGDNSLMNAYPDVFQNMYIARDPASKSYFIPPSEKYAGKIMIGGADDPARILAHEATHLVQQTEGFAPGTSRMAASEAASYPEILAQVKENPDAYYRGLGLTPEEKASYDWYRRQAGEVEARAAEARMNMTPEERRASLISSTADIPKEKVLTDAYGYEPKPVVNVGPVPTEQQTAISVADIAGQAAPEVQDHSFLDAFTGGGDQGPSDLSSFFNLMGAESPTDMSSLFGGGSDFGGYEGEDFAEGGSVGGPTVAQMKLALMKVNPANIKNLGVNEVLGQDPKLYFPADKQEDTVPPPGGVATPSGMPIGGVDMSQMQPGQQLMPQQPQGGPQQPPGAPQAPGGAPAPAAAPGAPQGGQSNILQMTPQGQAMAAMTPNQPPQPQQPGMAEGGKITKRMQTVKNAQRMAYPGIYGRPDEIAALAASRVAPEDPALKQLFGVTREDMYELAKGRQGMPHLGMLPGGAANPKGAASAEGVMTKRNEQRLLDVMAEAEKHKGLIHGMDPWYYMDPLFNQMVKLLGIEKATQEYKKMNALMGMASSSSEVNTEIPRGSLAYYLANQGRFAEFEKHGGKRSPDRPKDFGETPGHLAHKTAHALPMRKFIERGEVDMTSPKVPMYIEASGVPATGFQTRTPVGDAHWSRAVGLADTRNPKTIKGQVMVPGQSVSNPEMASLGPWWKEKIAAKLGLESVPAQARAWGAFSPQTGVTTPIGAPKLELIAKQIMQTAKRRGISPETARDLVLTGKERMGMKKGGKVSTDAMRLALTKTKKAK